MVQGENSDDSHYETPWIYPWVNINSKWSNSAFSLLNDPLNNKTCCIADKNDSGKIQIWAVGKIPGKKQIKFISVQVRCSFTNYPLLGSIRLKEGEWESWEKFDWAVEFGFRIDGDFILIENADIDAFVSSLDKQFEMWGKTEKSSI